MQSLADLMKSLNIDIVDYQINQVCDDSRNVNTDDLFICIPCARDLENAKQAVANGAKVLVAQAKILQHFSNQVICIEYDNPRLALSLLAKAYFKLQPSTLISVTGTNGKSSVVSLVRQLWHLLGYKSASFGTVGLEIDSSYYPDNLQKIPSLTTYGCLSFSKLLKDLASAGINHVVFEASSHGLDQYRIHGSDLAVAGFTNFTQDHLDYHKDMESYLLAKLKLFKEVLPHSGIAVLNANSPYFEQIKNQISNQILSYGVEVLADLYATNVKTYSAKIVFDLNYKTQMFPEITLNLSGAFQVENVLCAIAIVISAGDSLESILSLLQHLKSVSGRMEFVGKTKTEADVYVDYAHTPDALERALKSLRSHTKNNVWVVFGCGGDRDSSKRPIMGKIAKQFADQVIITDDNPRSEDPSYIRQQIIGDFDFKEIADRKEAIMYCIAQLEKGDSLLIAGKGHESGQIIGNKIYPFNDQQQAKSALGGIP